MALASPGAAQAALASNDERDSATVVTALPFTDTSSTIAATVNESDPPSNCFGLGGSIWYTFTAPADMDVLLDMAGSSVEAVVDVYKQNQESLEYMDCYHDLSDPQRPLRLHVTAGTTYYVAVRSWGGYTSGDATFNLRQAPPPLSNAVVAVQKGTVTRQGAVTLTGTITCDADAYAYFAVNGSQANRRFTAQGGQGVATPCSKAPTAWSVTFASQTGVSFVSGGMTANYSGDAYDNMIGHAAVFGSGNMRLTGTR